MLAVLLSAAAAVFSEVPIREPVLSGNPTGIAPAFFGPNAFPIPDMLDGRTQDKLRVELAADGYFGTQKDKTANIFARVYIPLFTPRVNLTLWMPVMEWYEVPLQRQQTCRIEQSDSAGLKGHEAGDAYVSTDIQILRQSRWAPDIAIRAAIKSASGGSFGKARYYDNPGYFFDAAIGKSFYIGNPDSSFPYASPEGAALELRLAGSAGFLCWQTDNGRQNDAVMYGLQLLAKTQYVSLRCTWSGYVGWEDYGDCPMSIKAILAGHVKGFEPFVQYQYGIKDYPFHQLRIGMAYHFDILKQSH